MQAVKTPRGFGGQRLGFKYVQGGAEQAAGAQAVGQRFLVHHAAARGVDEDCTGFHAGQAAGID